MKPIELFYQGEGVDQIDRLELDPSITFAALKDQLLERHGVSEDAMLFVEDGDDPVDLTGPVSELATSKGLRLHLHRCLHVEITVSFNGQTVERRFAPSATIRRVKRWAAERKFDMSPEDASEHSLQVSGTQTQPDGTVHLGTLTDGKVCRLAFDLVPEPRVNGWSSK